MTPEPNLALRRSKRTGMQICMVAAVLGGLFLDGLVGGSYWALAVPVAIGVLAVLLLAFWIGWTINTIDTIPPEAEPYESRFARKAGGAVCVTSVVLALAFLAGVWERSYWALALPVAVAVLGVLGMVFHIGWAILTQRSTLDLHEDGTGMEEEEEWADDSTSGREPS